MRTLTVAEPYEPGDGGYSGYAGGGYSFPIVTADLLADVCYLSAVQTVTGEKKFGGNTHYTSFEADGTMKAAGDATTWKDLVFPIIPKFIGPGNPAYNTFVGGVTAPQFLVNDGVQLDASEFVHEWKEGSLCDVHLHWTSMDNVAAARAVKWEVGYTFVNKSDGTSQWGAEVVLQVEATIPANTPALTEFRTLMGTFTPASAKIGGQIRLRLKRIAAAGTAPAVDPFATQLGIHIECDTLGSRTISAK